MRLGDIQTYNRHIQSAYCSKNQYPYIILPIYNLFMRYSSPCTVPMPSQHFTNLDKMILTNMSTRAHTPSGEIGKYELFHRNTVSCLLKLSLKLRIEQKSLCVLHSLSYPGCCAFSRARLFLFCKLRYFLLLQHIISQKFCSVVTAVVIYSESCSIQLLQIQSQNCQDIALISALHLFLLAQLHFEFIILLICLLLTVCHIRDS